MQNYYLLLSNINSNPFAIFSAQPSSFHVNYLLTKTFPRDSIMDSTRSGSSSTNFFSSTFHCLCASKQCVKRTRLYLLYKRASRNTRAFYTRALVRDFEQDEKRTNRKSKTSEVVDLPLSSFKLQPAEECFFIFLFFHIS